MRYFVLLLAGVLFGSSCGKKVEEMQLDALMELITNGQWVATRFVKGSEDVTAQFAPYSFQFNRNETVDAIRGNVVERTGSWVGNTTDLTITSSFGNAAAPLAYLNGTWRITKTSTSFVEASQVVGGEQWLLRLDKK